MTNKSTIQINLRQLVTFFDEKPPHSRGHSGALVAILGEELALAMFEDFVRRKQGGEFKLLDKKCTPGIPGTRRGKQLDAWIKTTNEGETIYYQTEIKNMSPHSINQIPFPKERTEEKMCDYRKKNYERTFPKKEYGTLHEGFYKVLYKMSENGLNKEKGALTKTLLCIWTGMHQKGKNEPFFEVCSKEFELDKKSLRDNPIQNEKVFEKLCIFSMSTYAWYLLSKEIPKIDVNLPKFGERIEWIKCITS